MLDDALDHALTEPTGALGTALVLVDIDAFRSINDQLGHPIGDDALVHLAGLLRSVLSRMGGDELAVLLPDCPADVAARRADQLLDAVRRSPLVLDDGTPLALSVSLGVAHAPTHAQGRWSSCTPRPTPRCTPPSAAAGTGCPSPPADGSVPRLAPSLRGVRRTGSFT